MDLETKSNSTGLYQHFHFDDLFDLVDIENQSKPVNSQFEFQSTPNFPKDNYSLIWKPPVIS